MASAADATPIPVSIAASPDPLGVGWSFSCIQTVFGVCVLYGVDEDFQHTVSVGLSDGSVDVFEVLASGATVQISGPVSGSIQFVPLVGTLGVLTALDSNQFESLSSGELLDLDLEVLDPTRFRYTLGGVDYLLPDFFDVPEPTAVWLLAPALGVLTVARRRAHGR